ncbi:MAG: hypothetical protein IJJ31_02260 [Mogibacterium sp.]|nr:hypothetical protein [Mogibacterium sp.]
MKNKSLRNWIISLAANTAIMAAVFMLSEVTYETNDDFAIAAEIASGYPFVGFVSVYLCRILMLIQKIFPAANIFMISQLVMSFIAFTVLIKVILDRQESVLLSVLSLLLVLFYSMDHYGCMQFTKTSALLMTAGLIWIADTYLHERRAACFILAFALYFIGVAYRQKGMFPSIAFVALFMLLWWLTNGKEFFGGRKPLPEIGLVLIIVIAMLVPYGLDKASDAANAGTPELKAGRQYQAERVKVTDYPMLDYIEDNIGEYEAVGLDQNDLELIDRWFFDYDGAASYDNLKVINSINGPYAEADKSVVKAVKRAVKRSLESVLAMDKNGLHIIFVLLIVLYLLAERKPKIWMYILALGILTVVLYTAVYYMKRVQYRAIYIADVNITFWLLYIAAVSGRSEKKAAGSIVLAVTILAVALSIPGQLDYLQSRVNYNSSLIEAPEVTEYLQAHPDSFYVMPTVLNSQTQSYMTPLKAPVVAANLTDTGGWDTMTPYKLEQLRAYGIENPVRDLINNPDVYYFGDFKVKGLTEYYDKWYCKEGEKAEFIKVDELADQGIYRVVIRKQ